MILVTGATGNFGSYVAKELIKNGADIKVASLENSKKMDELYPQGVTRASYDLNDPNTFDELLEGVKSIYLVAPSGSSQFSEQIIPLLVKAKIKQVKHVVLTTVLGADANKNGSHFKAEEALRNSGLNYTIIRPNFIFQNFVNYDLWSIKTNQIYLPTGDGRTSYNDLRDIAEAISNILLNPFAHNEKTYSVTGSEALSHSDMANVFSHVLNRNVINVNPSEEEYKETLLKFGVPDTSVDFLATLYSFIKQSYFKTITTDLSRLLGREPRKFNDFVIDYRNHFENN